MIINELIEAGNEIISIPASTLALLFLMSIMCGAFCCDGFVLIIRFFYKLIKRKEGKKSGN